MRVEYMRVEPPGIPTAFWRSVGPSHNVFVVESFMDELAAAARQDPVAYRLALLDKTPRAKAVLALAGLRAHFLGSIETHSLVQDFFFDENLGLRRHDYGVNIAGGFGAAQLTSHYVVAMTKEGSHRR
jgi:CO/xanthine dehydrogenase Mo-binding subunit